MRSACWMVLRRCAMTRAVRPDNKRFNASRMSSSVLVSTLEVASSRIRKRGLCASARAKLMRDRKSTRLNSSHLVISYAVFCLKKKKKKNEQWQSNERKHRENPATQP